MQLGPYEECREPLTDGDDVAFTGDRRRFWHTKCFEGSLLPISQLSGRDGTVTAPTAPPTEPQREPISLSDINERYRLDRNYGMSEE